MNACYLIGVPGSGKSTLLRTITAGLDTSWERRPLAHALYWRGTNLAGAQLGAHHPHFPGTDRLSMSVQPTAIALVAARPWPVVIAEGDRLATNAFLTALRDHSDTFTLLYLNTPDQLAAERRATRSASTPTAAWLQGRTTKVRNLTTTWPHTELDGTLPPDQLAQAAIAASPALQALTALPSHP